jgi:hypothetical protein
MVSVAPLERSSRPTQSFPPACLTNYPNALEQEICRSQSDKTKVFSRDKCIHICEQCQVVEIMVFLMLDVKQPHPLPPHSTFPLLRNREPQFLTWSAAAEGEARHRDEVSGAGRSPATPLWQSPNGATAHVLPGQPLKKSTVRLKLRQVFLLGGQ